MNETVRVAEELHLARRVAELRERHEALRKRLEWRDRLEHTPRAVLRRSLFTSEEEAIIRFIEPALAIRTVKDARYDPFANGPDLSWAVTDEERARRAAAEARGDASAAEARGWRPRRARNTRAARLDGTRRRSPSARRRRLGARRRRMGARHGERCAREGARGRANGSSPRSCATPSDASSDGTRLRARSRA